MAECTGKDSNHDQKTAQKKIKSLLPTFELVFMSRADHLLQRIHRALRLGLCITARGLVARENYGRSEKAFATVKPFADAAQVAARIH
jgi:hypothetical protein